MRMGHERPLPRRYRSGVTHVVYHGGRMRAGPVDEVPASFRWHVGGQPIQALQPACAVFTHYAFVE